MERKTVPDSSSSCVECPVAKRCSCPWRHQSHGVRRSLQCAPADGAGECRVVCKIWRHQFMECIEDEHRDLVLDSLADRQPVEPAEDWCYIVLSRNVNANQKYGHWSGIERGVRNARMLQKEEKKWHG